MLEAADQILDSAAALSAASESELSELERYLDLCDHFYLGKGPRDEVILDLCLQQGVDCHDECLRCMLLFD